MGDPMKLVITENVRLRVLPSPQDGLVATPFKGVPFQVQHPYAACNSFGTGHHGLQKALPPLSSDVQHITLDTFTTSGKVGRPKNVEEADALIKHVIKGVKEGSANCALVLNKKFGAVTVRFDENQFQELEKRGAGVSGCVTAYKDASSGTVFARKHMKDGKKLREEEVASMLRLRHPNICQVYALACYDGSVDIIMEDAGRSLFTCLRELRTRLDSEAGMQAYYGVVQDLACQGFQALRHMHRHEVYHLDLKPDNILVNLNADKQLRLMVADFGSSLIGDQLMSFSMQLTPEYWAPELWERIAPHLRSETDYLSLQKEQFPPRASFDTYAMGLTVYFMCTLRHLLKALEAKFIGASNDIKRSFNFKAQLMTQHADRIAGWATEGPFPHGPLPQILQELLRNTLHPDPNKRWTDSQAVEWLSGEPVRDEEEEEEEVREVELQVPTQVHDPGLAYTAEAMTVEEDLWQTAVAAVHDEGDHFFGTASFQSGQDIDVKGQLRPGIAFRNVQPSQDAGFQDSKHELVAGACTNLPASLQQQAAQQHKKLTDYCTVQLNNSFALMELDDLSHAAEQGIVAHEFDLDLVRGETTSQDCVPDVLLADQNQLEKKPAWKPQQFVGQGPGGETPFAGKTLDGWGMMALSREMGGRNQQVVLEEGNETLGIPAHPLAPDLVNGIPPPVASLGKGGYARAPSKQIFKKGKAISSKSQGHPYGVKSQGIVGKHVPPQSIGKRMIIPAVLEQQANPLQISPPATFFVAGSAAPTPAARTMQELPAATTVGEDVIVKKMPRANISSACYINPWAVEASEQPQPAFGMQPAWHAPIQVFIVQPDGRAPVREAVGWEQEQLACEAQLTVKKVQTVQRQPVLEAHSATQMSSEPTVQQPQNGNIPHFGMLF